jgi:uncharacterized protein YjbI with pentapeptide repeats
MSFYPPDSGANSSPTKRFISGLQRWFVTSSASRRMVNVAETLGKLTVFFGILAFILEAPDRARQRHYQAWELLNLASGHAGEAGRSIAFDVLVRDHQPMRNIDLKGATISELSLNGAQMPGAIFDETTLKNVDWSCKVTVEMSRYWVPTLSLCSRTDLRGAKFYNNEITKVNFNGAILQFANFGNPVSLQSIISDSVFDNANLEGITVDNTILQNNSFLNSSFNRDCRYRRATTEAKLNNNCIRWTHVNFRGKNNFSGIDLSNSSWIQVQLFTDENGNRADFTDANLEGIQFTDDPVPGSGGWKILAADSPILTNAILCRTKANLWRFR